VYHPAHGCFAHSPRGQGSGRVSSAAFTVWKLKVYLLAVGKSSQGGRSQDTKSIVL